MKATRGLVGRCVIAICGTASLCASMNEILIPKESMAEGGAGASAMSMGLRWARLAGAVGLLSAMLFSVGCATAQVRKSEGTGAGAALAILSAQHSKLEMKAAGCIADAVRAAHPMLGIVTADEFRRTVFAYWTPDEPAERAKYFEVLVREPALRDRMASLGIRYLVYLVETRTDDRFHNNFPILCGGGPGGAGCLGAGAAWTERDTRLVASVVDVQGARAAGEVSASAKGRFGVAGAVFVIFPLVLPIPDFPETRACAKLGEAVAGFLGGDAPAADSEEKGVVK